MNHLIDQNARDRFTTELEQNFSVIAPAGVGKTHAITQRIVALAEAQDKAATQNEFLSRLVIVTYTNKAASEMQQRAREALLKTKVSARTISLFNQAFFGTIHGFCMKLLSSYGYALGLPGNFQPLLQDDDVWEAFLQRGLLLDKITNQAKLQQLLRVMPIEAILTLARHLPPGPPARDSSDRLALDAIDFTEIQTFEEKGTGKANIIRSKQALAQWLEKLHHHLGYTGLPQLFGTHKKLTSAWKPIMEKLGSQLSLLLYPVVYEMAEQYRDFRLSEGLITYDDQVAFAEKLIWHTDVGSEIRGMMYRVILDEAQDTDPRQFGVLLDVVRSVKAERSWVEDANRHHPEPGRFCMVGDPQQSIYGSRADLSFYKRAHAYVSRSNCGEEVTFAVTFRCDQKIIDFVNTLFPRLLPGDQGQAEFVPLRERPDIAEGQVIRWTLEDDWDSQEDAPTTEQCMLREASMVARKLKETGLTALRAECWSEVAILCPRRAWLEILSKALRKEGFEIDLHSRDHKKGDSPVYAWFVSLMTCLAEPWREYEIVGLLREVFGFSDEQLYEHRSAKGSFKIQVQQPNVGHPEVRKTITLLHELRDKTSRWSLAQAVDEIVRSVQLQDRLVGIQAAENQWPEQQHVCEGIDIPRELDTLLMEAVLAEENELLFEEWVKELQGTFTMETPQETLVNPHALQLITCQKAKGLQWAAVVIPFLNAEIGSVSPRYPMAIKQGIDAAPLLVPQSVFYPDVEKETARLKTLQEFVRLSYVTLTRAKRTLILCDDFKLFSHSKRRRIDPKFSQLTQLGDPSDPSSVFASLPETCTVDLLDTEQTEQKPTHVMITDASETISLPMAQSSADLFPRRILPHSLSHGSNEQATEEPEQRSNAEPEWPVPAEDNPGIRYGTWWHSFMERLPWQDGEASCRACFDLNAQDAPDAQRAEIEFALLLKSEIYEILCQSQWVIHQETPFMAQLHEDECLDGIIDLAAFHQERQEWLIIDWKTDRIQKPKDLIEKYNAQIHAYLQAMQQLTDCPAKGLLYSTRQGKSVSVI